MKQGGSFKRQSLISAPGRVEQAKSTSLHHSAYEYSGGDAYRNSLAMPIETVALTVSTGCRCRRLIVFVFCTFTGPINLPQLRENHLNYNGAIISPL
jgi:hypothetical protein